MALIEELRKKRIIGIGEPRELDKRNEYEMDYARLIHSSAFRRLQGKSQVFSAGSGDYYRTRLTHSLEVAQIARHVAGRLTNDPLINDKRHAGLIIDPTVVECAALAHDFGHPPFGHKGEKVLNDILNKHGLGYEGNAQNFRILMFLEKKANYDGLDLTSAVLLATNKYPYKGNGKGLYSTEWSAINNIRQEWGIPDGKPTLEAQLMDICDDIAYSTHDIEDGLRAGKINIHIMQNDKVRKYVVEELNKYKSDIWDDIDLDNFVIGVMESYVKKWTEMYEKCGKEDSRTRREVKGYWVNKFVTSLGIIEDDNWMRVTFMKEGRESKHTLREMIVLKKLAWVTLVEDLRVQRLQKRSERIVEGLWNAFENIDSGKHIIPADWIERFQQHDEWSWERLVADYISGMTDAYAEKVYGEIYGNSVGSIYGID